ncbi:hypothetical protein L1987_74894 [Smallanthus sonchifolius]|uniref:Uncharacterized protein n=1 Tax=Smallanthus sonchifolius TaxID=185202 RepID=A0ACB9A4A6_9ASTR|nr:hypothetical protein L1987_74894 [Smallanthus sonchifolius]
MPFKKHSFYIAHYSRAKGYPTEAKHKASLNSFKERCGIKLFTFPQMHQTPAEAKHMQIHLDVDDDDDIVPIFSVSSSSFVVPSLVFVEMMKNKCPMSDYEFDHAQHLLRAIDIYEFPG